MKIFARRIASEGDAQALEAEVNEWTASARVAQGTAPTTNFSAVGEMLVVTVFYSEPKEVPRDARGRE